MPARILGLVRQWFCSIKEVSRFICCSIWFAYSRIKSSITQVTLKRAQQKFHSPPNNALPSCKDSRKAAASKGDTSGTTIGSRHKISGFCDDEIGSRADSCSQSASWKKPERIFRTSTAQRTAAHSFVDCNRISTAELGDSLLTFGATILASEFPLGCI